MHNVCPLCPYRHCCRGCSVMLFVRKSNKIFGFGYAACRSCFTAGACTLPARLKILSAHLKTTLLPFKVPYICIRIREQSLHKQEVKFFSHIGFDWFLKCPATSNAGHFFCFYPQLFRHLYKWGKCLLRFFVSLQSHPQ